MTIFPTRQDHEATMPGTELAPVETTVPAARIVSGNPLEPTYPQVITSARYQGAYAHPHDLLAPHIGKLMGQTHRQPPRWLARTKDFFGHAADHHVLPAAGVLTMAGVSVWAHSEPYHPLIGAGIIAVGAYLVRSGIAAHRAHGADADAVFTKGLLGAGGALAFGGVGVCVGLTPWLAVAVVVALALGYAAHHTWTHHKLERAREFAVALTAAGNTGPLPVPPPSYGPGVLPVSDEEARVYSAFSKLRAPEVILSPVRREPGVEDVWSLFVDISDTTTTAEAITRDAGKLTTWMGARMVEVLPTPRPSAIKLVVHDGDDPTEQTIPWDGSTVASILDPIPLGIFEDGSPVTINLAWKHTLIAGTTEMGKSNVLSLILCSTLSCPDVVRILVDCKAGAPEFRAYKDVAFCVATNPEEGMRVLAGLEAVYQYRGQVLVDNDVPPSVTEDGETVQKWETRFGPFILAMIDELSELTITVKGAAKRIQRLRALQRYVGEFSVDATQIPNKDVFGGTTAARMNYLNRIVLALAEQLGVNIALGQGMYGRGWRPDQFDMPGKMFVYSPTNKRPRRARSYRVEPADIARAVAAMRGRVPELDEGSANAFWEAYHAEPMPQFEGNGGGGGPRGGQPQPVNDVPVGPFRPYIVPTYPNGDEIDEKHVQLWHALTDAGVDGATAVELAATAESAGHQYTSEAWIRQRLRFWKSQGYVRAVKEGREERHWVIEGKRRIVEGEVSA